MSEEQEQQAEGMELDEMEVDGSSSRAQRKVELDLDDAPFLDWSEDEEGGEDADQVGMEEEGPDEGEEEERDPSASRRRWALLGSLSGLLLLGAALAILWMVRGPDLKTKQPSPSVGQASQEAVQEQLPQEKELDFRPFWVEYAQKDRLRYLHFEFALGLESSQLAWEIKRKVPLLRDAIYYYLKNKGLAFLSEKANVEKLKEDLRGVINQNVSQGRIKDILIQTYVVE
jgi:flagellar FliL protein